MPTHVLELLKSQFTIHRFAAADTIPAALWGASFYWIGRTDEELSIVCESSFDLRGGQKNPGWACFKVSGPIDFSQTGILAGISKALASADVSIFAISTYDTDYILVPIRQLEIAKAALTQNGYHLQGARTKPH